MSIYTNIIIIITIAVAISYVNYRFVKMQPTIAIMSTSLFLSLILVILDRLGFHAVHNDVTNFISGLHFQHILMDCMLGLLLFAGSLTLDIPHLKRQKWEIGILSSCSTLVSTFMIGTIIYYLLFLLGLKLTFVECLLFGALISPTDPIAILAILKQIKAPKKVEMLVASESLLNDGVAVVIFMMLYQIAFVHESPTFISITMSFLHKAVGGVIFGTLLSAIAYVLMKPINDYKIELLITLALVTGGYTLAQSIGVSGPLAMVTVGIFIANNKHIIFQTDITRNYLSAFWEMIDELLNAILFLLIGAEILLVNFSFLLIIAALFAIPIVLATRYLTVAPPMWYFKHKGMYPKNIIRILTWGGLRGGIAVALALAFPSGHVRDILLPITYIVVVFSILVQGTTTKRLIMKSREQWGG